MAQRSRYFKSISEVTGQSAGYWVELDGKVCISSDSKSELNHYVVEGTTFELNSATGKVLLAYTDSRNKKK